MGVVSIKELLEAGVHFGHQTNRWNPKMKKFLFGERNGIYIIDLQQTVARMEQAYAFVRDTVASGQSVLFVGTKRQAAEILQEEAVRSNMFYVNQRWLGGMLTNFQTIRRSIDKMKKLEGMLADPAQYGLRAPCDGRGSPPPLFSSQATSKTPMWILIISPLVRRETEEGPGYVSPKALER